MDLDERAENLNSLHKASKVLGSKKTLQWPNQVGGYVEKIPCYHAPLSTYPQCIGVKITCAKRYNIKTLENIFCGYKSATFGRFFPINIAWNNCMQ